MRNALASHGETMLIALRTAATDELTKASLDTIKAFVCTNPQHPRPQLFGDILLGYHGVATATAVPGPGLCCGSLFRFVRACVRLVPCWRLC